MDLNKYGSPAA